MSSFFIEKASHMFDTECLGIKKGDSYFRIRYCNGKAHLFAELGLGFGFLPNAISIFTLIRL